MCLGEKSGNFLAVNYIFSFSQDPQDCCHGRQKWGGTCRANSLNICWDLISATEAH